MEDGGVRGRMGDVGRGWVCDCDCSDASALGSSGDEIGAGSEGWGTGGVVGGEGGVACIGSNSCGFGKNSSSCISAGREEACEGDEAGDSVRTRLEGRGEGLRSICWEGMVLAKGSDVSDPRTMYLDTLRGDVMRSPLTGRAGVSCGAECHIQALALALFCAPEHAKVLSSHGRSCADMVVNDMRVEHSVGRECFPTPVPATSVDA